MSETPRYMRFVYEFEIEVVDPVAAAAYTMAVADTGDDQLAVSMRHGDEADIIRAVHVVLGNGFARDAERAGFKSLGGSLIPRFRYPNGSFRPITLPSTPGRLDDGSDVFPPDE